MDPSRVATAIINSWTLLQDGSQEIGGKKAACWEHSTRTWKPLEIHVLFHKSLSSRVFAASPSSQEGSKLFQPPAYDATMPRRCHLELQWRWVVSYFADWLEDWLAALQEKPVLRVKLPIAQDGRNNILCLGSQPLRFQSQTLLLFFCKSIANRHNMLEHQHQPLKESPTCTAIVHSAYHTRSPDASIMANGSVGERMQSEQLWQPLQDLRLGVNGSCQAVFIHTL